MENKLVYRNDADISTFTWNHKSTLPKLQKVVNELKVLRISNFESVFEDLLNKGTGAKAQLQEIAGKEKKAFPSRVIIQSVEEQLKHDFAKVDELCSEVYSLCNTGISYRTQGLDLTLFEVQSDVVKLVDNFQDQVESRYSVFIDTPEKEEIYLKVMKVKEDIESLQIMINKKNGTLGVIASGEINDYCFLEIAPDRTIHLHGEYFDGI